MICWPKTIQGWRPISVKIQPAEIPKSGKSTMVALAMEANLPFGVRPPRKAHSAQSAYRAAIMPRPIIRRKPQ